MAQLSKKVELLVEKFSNRNDVSKESEEKKKLFRLALSKLSRSELIESAMYYLEKDQANNARDILSAAGVDMSPAEKLELGRILLKDGKQDHAERLFREVGAKDELLALGRGCLETADFDHAERLFREVGAKEELLALGMDYTKVDLLEKAFPILEEFGSKADLIQFGQHCVGLIKNVKVLEGSGCNPGATHEIAFARAAFARAGAKDELIALGKRCIEGHYTRGARFCFEAAGAKDELIDLGKYLLERGNGVRYARAAFRAAGVDPRPFGIEPESESDREERKSRSWSADFGDDDWQQRQRHGG